MRRSRSVLITRTKKSSGVTPKPSLPFLPARRRIGVALVCLGLFALLFPLAFKAVKSPPKISHQPSTPTASPSGQLSPLSKEPFRIANELLGSRELRQQPLRIIIPSVSIDVSVVEANVVGGYWEISETTASHGVGSANPGELGNTVIFAHARDDLFGRIRNIKNNATIYVLTKDRWHRYSVTTTKLVDPSAVEVIAPTKNEMLTLFTCSGFLDSKRQIVQAVPMRP
jgi:LPXTG-site transpeptidase (sortase) family protein